MQLIQKKNALHILVGTTIIVVIFSVCFVIGTLPNQTTASTNKPEESELLSRIVSAPRVLDKTVVEKVLVNESKTYPLNSDFNLLNSKNIPDFIKIENMAMTVSPPKMRGGKYDVKFANTTGTVTYSFNIENKLIDLKSVESQIRDYLGDNIDNYGILLHDLGRDQTMSINGDVILPPASMAKITMAMLVMRDIDAGKYTLEDTYPIQDSVKFSTIDDLGILPDGTEVTMDTYLTKLLEDSNNTAWYHLNKFLGDSYETVNPRTINELGVNPFFLNPHMGTANQIGKLWTDLYYAKTVSPKSRDYLINLLKNALEWNRQGVGLGLPEGIEFANKIGNLWTDDDINYCDSAIVWGNTTDYVLIIMDKDVDWETGRERLKEISSIVYNEVDK